MLCAIWYHLHNFKYVKNTHGGVLLLVKLYKFKLYKWYQIAQRITFISSNKFLEQLFKSNLVTGVCIV